MQFDTLSKHLAGAFNAILLLPKGHKAAFNYNAGFKLKIGDITKSVNGWRFGTRSEVQFALEFNRMWDHDASQE